MLTCLFEIGPARGAVIVSLGTNITGTGRITTNKY